MPPDNWIHDRSPSWLSRVSLEEIAGGCIIAFFAMQGAIPGIAPNQASEMTNTAATGWMKTAGIGSQVVIDGAICILALAHLRRLRRFAFAFQWTAVMAILAICSIAWSQDAVTTARRSLPFALATIFGLYLASRFHIRRQLQLFVSVMFLLALATAVVALAVPSIGLEASTGHFGNWQGVFTQKNACGRAMVFATAGVLAWDRLNLWRSICLLFFLLVLGMSGSRGAWVIECVLLVCNGLFHIIERVRPSQRAALFCGAFVLALAIAAAVYPYFPVIAGLLGRDSNLSGRTAIWQQVWTAIVKHPLLGYGFAAFWQGMKGESYNVILAIRFVVFHAHNGFLEIWLELGGIGLLLFALSYLRAWRKLWTVLQSSQLNCARWMIFILLLVVFYDLDENTLLVFNGLYWVLYVAALANIEIMAAELRQSRIHFRHSACTDAGVPARAVL